MLRETSPRLAAVAMLATLTALLLPAPPAGATTKTVPVTAIVSVTPSGQTGLGYSSEPSLSSNGRFVAFSSFTSDLVPGDTNAASDVFVRDTLAEATIRVSVSSSGGQAGAASDQPSISRDGRFVAFRSDATNLVPNDTNGVSDVFVRDLRLQTTTRVSVATGGGQVGGGGSSKPKLSSDGLLVTFESAATNLVAGDANAAPDVFVHDSFANTTELVSVTSAEAALSLGATAPAISGTGRYVVFTSLTNQVGTFTDSSIDVFLRDRALGTTERVSLSDSLAVHPNGLSDAGSVSDDGRYVAFKSMATNLTSYADFAGGTDVFVRDRNLGSTDLVSRSDANGPANQGGYAPAISANGSKVVFTTGSSNLVGGDTNGTTDIFVRDLPGSTTTRVSVTSGGGQLTGSSTAGAISSDGTAVGFQSNSTTAYPSDANGVFDVFVRSTFQIGPFATSTALVQRAAKDFTGAELPLGTAIATNDKLLYGTATPQSLITSYAHGAFDDHRGPVMRLYWAFFKRAPDKGGLDYWTKKHVNGTTIKAIANSFATSSEFQTNFGTGTDTEFITLVYQNVLERNPDPAGLAHWVAKLSTGVSRGEMMTNFSESSEGIRKMRGEVDSVLVILGMLHRVPTTGELIGYAKALELNGGQVTEVLVTAILTGAEYAALVA